MKSPHPSFEEILDATEGRTRSETVSAHVADCDACRAVADGVTQVLAAMSVARGLPEVPRAVRDRALEAVRRELAGARADVPGVAGFLRDLVARVGEAMDLVTGTLVADSLQPSAATRGGAEMTAVPRMLLYETADHDITLSIAPGATAGELEVTGQVTPRTGELPDDGVAGLRVGAHTATSELSRFGEFAFDAVPAGDLEVEIGIGGAVIRLQPIPRHEVE